MAYHAHWIYHRWNNLVMYATCSKCGGKAYHINYSQLDKKYPYCPHCKAMMDEEGK